MKAEHRHELKTNELAEWLSRLPEFWKKNYKVIIYVTVVVIIVAGAAYAKWYRKRRELAKQQAEVSELVAAVGRNKTQTILGGKEGFDYSNFFLVTANELETASRRVDAPTLAALALNKHAEALRAELHYRPVSVDAEAVRAQVAQAGKSYEKALAKAGDNATVAAMAKFGLGLCAEELGKFDQAESIYQEIIATPEYQGTVFVTQSKERLETVAEYKEPIRFAEAPAPASTNAQQPDLQLGPQALEPATYPLAPAVVDSNELSP